MKRYIVAIAVLSLVAVGPAYAKKPGDWIPPGHRHGDCGSNCGNNSNTNTNRNNNYNTNLNHQTQAQGQAQGQAQSNSLTVEAPPSAVTVENKGSGYRGFTNQIEMAYAPLPNYFLGRDVGSANVWSVKTMVMYKDTFTRLDVKKLLKGVKVDTNRYAKEDGKTDSVKVIFSPPKRSTVRQCAVIATEATSEEASSVNVLAAAVLDALDVGADLLLITAEGAASKLKSTGWGVGLAYSHATMAGNEQSSGIGSGGTGISGGSATYESFPWLHGIALKRR